MCVICEGLLKGTMTTDEARQATLKMIPSPHNDNVQDIVEMMEITNSMKTLSAWVSVGERLRERHD